MLINIRMKTVVITKLRKIHEWERERGDEGSFASHLLFPLLPLHFTPVNDQV